MDKRLGLKNWRAITIFLVFAVFFCLILFKMSYLAFIQDEFLNNRGKDLSEGIRPIKVYRASIYDRNQVPLATTIKRYDLYGLKGLHQSEIPASFLNKELFLKDKKLVKKTLLKKDLTLEELEFIKEIRNNLLEIEEHQTRIYPFGEQFSNIIGFSGKDGQGLEGFELIYDEILKGSDGLKKVFKNRNQQPFKKPQIIKEPIQGKDITLTLDQDYQFIAFKNLIEGAKKFQAKGGTIVILDNHLGEVLAAASYPSYNPNNTNRKIQRNRVFVDAFEPGSIMKPFAYALALKHKTIEPNAIIDTSPGSLTLNGKKIVDPRNYEKLSAREVIAKSSQVGASLITISIETKEFIEGLKSFGFSKPLSIDFPSINFGTINQRENISKHEVASLGYGYGLTASPIQIARAFSVFANGGLLKDFVIIKGDHVYENRVLEEGISNEILQALALVVEEGTGSLAKSKFAKVVGKTGTTHKVSSAGGYDDSSYTASFAGIAEIEKRSLTIFISFDEPGLDRYSGGTVAAPVFSNIIQDLVQLTIQ
ncbi:MAG: penicillin-binding protein 2 [Gammaproteobacteria bacterium]